METILNYLDTMFAAYPQTEQVRDLKNELMLNMEDKYKALLAEGKTPNEAVGTVIAEFGNIEELMQSVGVEKLGARKADKAAAQELPPASDDEVLSFIEDTKTSSGKIALGVLLCIVSPAALSDAGATGGKALLAIGFAALFLFVAAAVALFIMAGRQVEPYDAEEYYKKSVSTRMQEILRATQEKFKPTYTLWLCLGIGLCILSPLPLLVGALTSGASAGLARSVALLLLMAGVGVYMIIRVACIDECYQKLLRQGEYKHKHERSDFVKSFSAVSGTIATAIFLILGFARGAWGTAWIVFPLMGVLTSVVQSLSDAKNKKD